MIEKLIRTTDLSCEIFFKLTNFKILVKEKKHVGVFKGGGSVAGL